LGRILRIFDHYLDLVLDDKLSTGDPGITFRVHTPGATSVIDYFAVSDSLQDNIHEVMVIDSGYNLSDHASLVIDMYIPVALKPATCTTLRQGTKHFSFRWDHGDVLQSYLLSGELLSNVSIPSYLLNNTEYMNTPKSVISSDINQYYSSLVSALYFALVIFFILMGTPTLADICS